MHRIVIVDDEPHISEGLAKLIHHISPDTYETVTFSDSEAALAFLRSDARRANLLITDIRMPRMTGFELIEEANRLNPDMLCTIMTGFSEFEYAKKAIDLGVVSFLVKPIETEELKKLLERLSARTARGKSADSAADISVSKFSRETIYMKHEAEENYASFSMDAIAGKLQLSRDYLFRMYKKETGQNLTDYLLEVRIQKAKEFLMQPGKYKVYEVSELVGYSDYAYFSKIFKKETGMTPKYFQKFAEEK